MTRPGSTQVCDTGLGKAEGSAMEAAYRRRVANIESNAPSYDPYDGASAGKGPRAQRADLRELSQRILQRRDNGGYGSIREK
jgi:hypothetical protein